MKKWVSYLFPQTIARYSSQYNRDIRVVLDEGQLKLLVDGVRESGKAIRSMMQRGIKHFRLDRLDNPGRLLMLGVGGGTMLQMFRSYYPDIDIDAVDIDKTMVDIAQIHFGMVAGPKLSYYVADANDFARTPHGKQYDVIVVDLFIGLNIPDFVMDPEFLKGIHGMTASGGRVFINYSYWREYRQKSEVVIEKLRALFPNVESHIDNLNIFILAEK